jgi:adenine/guanine phosphoribosyltransferase-like PRPP-binding protein
MAVITIDFRAFVPDSRGNRLEEWESRGVQNSDRLRLYLRGPDEVERQIFWLLRKQQRNPERLRLRDEDDPDWTHRLEFDGPLSAELQRMLGLLQTILTLTKRRNLAIGLALDFYMAPDPELDPMSWPKTTAGSLVNSAKHRRNGNAYEALVDQLVEVVFAHDLYSGADVILTVPGHTASKESFGVILAQGVALKAGKPVLETQCSEDERPPAKDGGETSDLEALFSVNASVADKVALIVDDVYMSGRSMGAVATAARRARAKGVVGLVGARTLKKGGR